MVNQWFGPPVDAPVCELLQYVPTPTGQLCVQCTQPIQAGDRGLMIGYYGETAELRPIHHACLLKAVGVNSDAGADSAQ